MIPSISLDQLPDPLPEGVRVLDVREPVEWAHGHIEGAVHVPLMDLPQHVADLPATDRLLVVCKVGGRSAQAVGYLVQHGFDAVNLEGGMIDWADAGRAMLSETGRPAQVV